MTPKAENLSPVARIFSPSPNPNTSSSSKSHVPPLLFETNSLEESSSKDLSEKKIVCLKEGDLPNELWLEILSYLKPEDLRNVSLTCKDLYIISRDRLFWNSIDKLYGTSEDLAQYRLENQLFKNYRSLENAEKKIIDSVIHKLSPSLETLLLFPSVCEWTLTKLPSLTDKDTQTAIIKALHPILETENNPWSSICIYKSSNPDEPTEDKVLSYLKEVLTKLHERFTHGLKNSEEAITLGYSFKGMSSPRELAELGFNINQNLREEFAIVLSIIKTMPSVFSFCCGSILQKAIESGHLALVDALTEEKKVLGSKLPKSQTALWLAVKLGKRKIAKLLLEKGANPKEKGLSRTLASLAVKNHDLENLKLLIKEGDEDLNKAACSLGTLLHQAASNGFLDIVKYLCEIGADLNALNKFLATPLESALASDKLKIALALLKAGSVFTLEAIRTAMRKRYFEILNIFIQRYGVDYESEYGTLLSIAIEENHLDVAKFLKEQGANINFKPTREIHNYPIKYLFPEVKYIDKEIPALTPLLKAISKGSINMVKWLVREGADVFTPYQGKTPLGYAIETNPKGTITKFLKKKIEIKEQQLALDSTQTPGRRPEL